MNRNIETVHREAQIEDQLLFYDASCRIQIHFDDLDI